MQKHSLAFRWGVVGSAVASVVLLAGPTPSASAAISRPLTLQHKVIRHGPVHLEPGAFEGVSKRNVQSNNWAGYADKGHTFSLVKASWVEPKVACTSTDAIASFWVGLDGYGSKTVEQAGTLAFCRGGKVTHYTWWQMSSSDGAQLVHSTVHPGDHVTSSVTVSGHTYTLTVTDHTRSGNSFTKKTTCASCRNASAEWMAERPSGRGGLYPLAKFAMITFASAEVGVGSARGSISKYLHDSITMVNHSGSTLARVSGLGGGGSNFVATWLRAK